jgi:RNA polymerase sigma-70 factor (ECF subfamily)
MAIQGEISGALPWQAQAAEPDWDAVYGEMLPRVYNFFRYRLGNDAVAEDLTSLTFEKAWTQRTRYRRDLAGFATWLLSIARNVAIDHLRARRPHLPIEAADDVAAPGTPHDDYASAADLARLARLLKGLPAREQELVALKYGAEATNRAIAALTGLSESNVGTILHRVVQQLRRDW